MENKGRSIEDIVTSQDLSQKLKELKVKQNSLFYYGTFQGKEIECKLYNDFLVGTINKGSAFTASELADILPIYIDAVTTIAYTKGADYGEPTTYYFTMLMRRSSCIASTNDDALANSMAKMLIFLIENNKLSDVWKKQWLEE